MRLWKITQNVKTHLWKINRSSTKIKEIANMTSSSMIIAFFHLFTLPLEIHVFNKLELLKGLRINWPIHEKMRKYHTKALLRHSGSQHTWWASRCIELSLHRCTTWYHKTRYWGLKNKKVWCITVPSYWTIKLYDFSFCRLTRIYNGFSGLYMFLTKHSDDQTEEHIDHNHDNVWFVEAAKHYMFREKDLERGKNKLNEQL